MLGLMHDKAYTFHLKKPPAEWASARPHEQQMLSALFDGGANPDVNLSDLQNHFYTNLPPSATRSSMRSSATVIICIARTPSARDTSAWALSSAFCCSLADGYLAGRRACRPSRGLLAGILTGIIICGFGWFMPARTITGVRTLEKVLGFEDFLSRTQKDQIDRLEKTPELFEKYLPYAMALRVEKKWAQAFSGIALQPPILVSGLLRQPAFSLIC